MHKSPSELGRPLYTGGAARLVSSIERFHCTSFYFLYCDISSPATPFPSTLLCSGTRLVSQPCLALLSTTALSACWGRGQRTLTQSGHVLSSIDRVSGSSAHSSPDRTSLSWFNLVIQMVNTVRVYMCNRFISYILLQYGFLLIVL